MKFGLKIEGYDYRVLNEREIRASAGIMFLLGFMSLFSVYVERTIFWAELYSIIIITEFLIRVVINPIYAPFMLLGGLAVKNQQYEWVEARPKHFAWTIGLGLGAVMSYYIIFDVVSLSRMVICWVCLALMFIESAFGICLGCVLYKKMKWKTYNCAGGICDLPPPPYKKSKLVYIFLFILFVIAVYFILRQMELSELPVETLVI